MARRHDNQAHRQQLRYLRRLPVCGVDTTGLAASLPILPVGLACHRRSSEHVGENDMSLLSGSSQVESCWGWSQSPPHRVKSQPSNLSLPIFITLPCPDREQNCEQPLQDIEGNVGIDLRVADDVVRYIFFFSDKPKKNSVVPTNLKGSLR